MRYYFYDTANRQFVAATTEASGRSLFGKSGYLGVFTSNAERAIYKDLRRGDLHLGITDVATEGKWVITAGPRTGEVFWNHGTTSYGASITDWTSRGQIWRYGDPNNRNNEDYARIFSSNMQVWDSDDGSRDSVSHHDLWLSEGEIFFQRVSVAKSPPNPILEVHFEKLRVNADARQVLTENHILVKDVDTRDPLDNTKVDASKITLRVSGLQGGTLQSSTSGSWQNIDLTPSTQYREFTLADLQAGKVSLVAGDGVTSGKGKDHLPDTGCG